MKTNVFKYIFFLIVIFLVGLAIYLLYIDGKKQVYAIENNEKELTFAEELNIGISNFDTINPILSNNRDIQYIGKLIFEPLIDISKDFKIENKLAKEFSKINDKAYIVKLRDDVLWQDGEKFTADDVVFTINGIKNNNINSIYKDNVKDINSLQKIDEYTIKITLNQEVDFFEYMMCIPILAKHSYNANTLNSNNNIPIGTGEFKISKIENDNILLEKSNIDNESKITKINLILKQSAKDLYTALTKGEIDFMVTDNIQYEEYIGSIGYNIVQYQNRGFDYLVLNTQSSLLKNKEVRKAINYAIDKNKLNYAIYGNKYSICDFPLDYGNYLYNSETKNEYDESKAKSILIEDGWVLKNNTWRKNYKKLSLKLLVNKENENRVKVAENIKEQLEKVGFVININKVDEINMNYYIKNKNYDIILSGNLVSNSPNLKTYLAESNLSNFKNDEINNILNEIKNIDDEEMLKEKYQKINEIYKEEVPFISLYFNNIFVLASKSLKGDLSGNWYNIYYNIGNWYKIK